MKRKFSYIHFIIKCLRFDYEKALTERFRKIHNNNINVYRPRRSTDSRIFHAKTHAAEDIPETKRGRYCRLILSENTTGVTSYFYKVIMDLKIIM